jgi:PilZ domain
MGGQLTALQVDIERARRFSIQMSMRYRIMGETGWRTGFTENVSSSGVLFRSDQVEPLNTQVEMSLSLPAESSDNPAELLCRGVIVRADPPGDGETLATLASRISRYQFLRL